MAGLCALAFEASALDPPHNGQNSLHVLMSCDACHYTTSGPTPSWATQQTTTDATFFNNLCTSCHKPTSMTESRFVVKTHSSGNTSNKYGNWSIECRICHNPHYQDQVSMYPSDASADLLSGTIGPFVQPPVSALETTIPIVGGGLVANAWIDHTFVPNTAYPTRMYRIKSNAADAVTVYGPVNGRYAAAGSHFAIRLGKLVLGQVPTPYTGKKQVKFFRESGERSFATSTDPADMTSICQVCHENTTSFNSRGDLEGPGHPSLQAGGNCTQCHSHLSGFKPACGSCHGNPPIVSTQGGPNGLANNEGGTGSTTPGAHGKHAISAGIACDACHESGMPETPIYDKLIQVGFNIANGLYKTGSYDGRATLANGYTYTRGNAGTTVTKTGTKVCSNVYCHGSTMAPNAGTDITPVWDNPSTGACGTCHGATALAYPTRGSHSKHVRTELMGYAYPCSTCHRDPSIDVSLHVNGRSEVLFSGASASGGAYSGTPAMLDAYGTCTNVYCHSTVQSSPPGGPPVYRTTPAWGDPLWSCGACHDYGTGLATGSHGKHMEMAELQECWACHNYTGIDDGCMACHDPDSIEPKRDLHANHAINVSLTPRYGGNYSGLPAPGDAYGQCTAVYCHSTVQSSPPGGAVTYAAPTWGNAASGQCGSCHRGDGEQGNGNRMNSGGHPAHVGLTTPSGDSAYPCGTCHAGRGASTDYHADKRIDVAFDPVYGGTYTGTPAPGDAYGGCANIYCHSTVQGAPDPTQPPQYKSPPPWGQTLSGICGMGACHDVGYPHTEDASSGTFTRLTSGSHGKHVLYKFDQVGNCEACHYKTGNCQDCHVFHGGETHVDRVITVAFDPDFPAMPTGGGGGSYSGDPAPRTPYGSCTDLYCHSPGTSRQPPYGTPNVNPVTWGTGTLPADCTGCHGGDRNASALMATGSHAKHVASAAIDCTSCHAQTVSDSRTPNPASYNGSRTYGYQYHVNGWINIAYSGLAGTSGTYAGQSSPVPNRAPGSAYGSCGSLYCHSTGQGIADPTEPPVYAAPSWGEPASGACGTCHDLGSHTGGWGTPVSSGSHSAHFLYDYSFGVSPSNCQVCHYVSTTGSTCAICHPEGSSYSDRGSYKRNAANHVNGQIDVDFLAAISGSTATYSGDLLPRTAYGSCSNGYCHSDGTSRATGIIPANASPVWGVAGKLACNACHGFPPGYPSGSPKANSHTSHSSYSCAQCHNTTTLDGTSIASYLNHVDLSYDVSPRADRYFAYAFGTCSQVSCHGNTGAVWGSPASYSCADLDGDGICMDDNCPTMANPGQEDANGNGVGDVCDAWLSVSAGQWHSVARKSDGSLRTWGFGEMGSLGIGVQESRLTPAQAGPDTNWVGSAGGQFHSVAVKTDNTLWAWGANSSGQLGTGTTSMSLSPVRVGSSSNWLAVAAGASHTLAIKTDGTLWTWGSNNAGQLGLGNPAITRELSPVQVGAETGWTHIAAGENHCLAIQSGTLWAWGYNASGQLGDGSTTQKYAPVQIGSDSDWVKIAAGANHGLAIKSNGTLWAWGSNSFGQLGDGTTARKLAPVRIGTDTDWDSVSGGNWHTIALKTNHSLWSWGGNSYGQLGDNTTTNRSSPLQVGTDTTWVSIASGIGHNLAVKSDGSLWTWGYNSDGQVGDGTKTNRLAPERID